MPDFQLNFNFVGLVFLLIALELLYYFTYMMD